MIRYVDGHPGELSEVLRELRTSPYERVSGLLVASLILAGCWVAALLMLWLSDRESFDRPYPAPTGGGGESSWSGGGDTTAEVPLAGEVADLLLPYESAELSRVLAAVSDDVLLEDIALATGAGTGRTEGPAGSSDSRPPGPPGEPDGERAQRWEIRFSTTSLPDYVRQLDAFGIELGVVAGPSEIAYASKLGRPEPVVRTSSAADESRLFMIWREGSLKVLDRQLLEESGLETAGRVWMQFYPAELEARLAMLERERAGARPLDQIVRTVFAVRRTPDGYEFHVLDQRYR